MRSTHIGRLYQTQLIPSTTLLHLPPNLEERHYASWSHLGGTKWAKGVRDTLWLIRGFGEFGEFREIGEIGVMGAIK